eukprot:GEMP01004952.1.p1 GENE.GEMP01004952.1~~GEMP01004952.1.p1  ORF type:complete len:1077 (+),score=264.62 GEMP01004952.1:159-3389(+)
MTTEAFRQEVSAQLAGLTREDGPNEAIFPATLSSEQRKYVHRLASQFKLHSRSTGKGANRYISVKVKSKTDADFEQIPVTKLTVAESTVAKIMGLDVGEETPYVLKSDSLKSFRTKSSRASVKPGTPLKDPLKAIRKKLPIAQKKIEFLDAMTNNQVVIVLGATGCGKSTQIPRFLLDADRNANIIVAQPRRISAMSVASRVSQEAGEQIGAQIGYTVHLESCTSASTRCQFVTNGVLRRRLFHDPQLTGVTHLILDEMHEREKVADFVATCVKELLHERRNDAVNLKVIVMSATLDVHTFKEYFADHGLIEVEGRTFPVKDVFLDEIGPMLLKHVDPKYLGPAFAAAGLFMDEKTFKYQCIIQFPHHSDGVCGFGHNIARAFDNDQKRLDDALAKHDILQQVRGLVHDVTLIEALIAHIDFADRETHPTSAHDRAILVFLPGWEDISRVKKALEHSKLINALEMLWILPLHSSIRLEDQRLVFTRAAIGKRKVVLATNIAETSITIDDISFVVDGGRVKETSYDAHLKVPTLVTSWTSQASSTQRAGRAGRTREGICYKIYSRMRYGMLDAFLLPEILRSPLEETYLHTMLWQRLHYSSSVMEEQRKKREEISAVDRFFAAMPNPPPRLALDNARSTLARMGALTTRGNDNDDAQLLTQLGTVLCRLPLSPALAKAVLWAVLLGVVDEVVIVVAGMSYREPWSTGGMMNISLANANKKIRQSKRALCAPYLSDHIALLEAFMGYMKCGTYERQQQFCENTNLSLRAMRTWEENVKRLGQELRKLYPKEKELTFSRRHAGNYDLVMASLAAALFPNMAKRDLASKRLTTVMGMDASTASSSVYDVAGRSRQEECGAVGTDQDGFPMSVGEEWVCFNELTQVEECYSLSQVSIVYPLVHVLLLGEDDCTVQNDGVADEATNADPYAAWYADDDANDDNDSDVTQLWLHAKEPDARFTVASSGLAQQLSRTRFRLRQIFLRFCDELRVPPAGEQAFLDTMCDILGRCSKQAAQDMPEVPAPMPNAFEKFPNAFWRGKGGKNGRKGKGRGGDEESRGKGKGKGRKNGKSRRNGDAHSYY